MSRLNWNAQEGRFFETGLDRGVLYPKGTPPVGPVIATNLATNPSFELASGGAAVAQTNMATNPSMELGGAAVDVNFNYVTDPRYTNLASWGSTGGGATTLTNMGDGRLRQTYAATGGPFLAQLAPPNVEVAATQGQSMTVKFGYQGPGGAQVVIHHRDSVDNIVDQTVYNLPNSPGAEVQISVTATVAAQSVTHLFLAQIAYNGAATMPANSVHYFRGVIWTRDPNATFFTGATPAGNDMTYAWSGTADASISAQRGVAVPSYAGSSSYAIRRSTWSSSGAYSMEIRSSGSSTDSYADVGSLGLVLTGNKTYTFSATFNTPTAQTGATNARSRKICVFHRIGAGTYTEVQSAAAPTTGVGRVSVSVTIPSGTTEVLVRLYNGSGVFGQSVFVDDLMVVESPYNVAYFDGTTPTNLMPNPNFDVNTTGWATTGGTLSRSIENPMQGKTAHGRLVTTTPQSLYNNPQMVGTPNSGYSARVRVRGTGTCRLRLVSIPGGAVFKDSVTVTLTSDWQYVTVSGTSGSSVTNVYVILDQLSSGSQTMEFVDFVLVNSAFLPDDEFTYSWAGVANASQSRMVFNSVPSGTPGAALAVLSTDWASSGTKSLRLYSTYHTVASAYYDIGQFTPDWGKTYTIRTKIRVREQLTTAPGIVAQTTGMVPKNYYAESRVPLTNGVVAPGVYDVSLTMTWPAFVTGMNKYLRLYNSNLYGNSVWFDDLLVTEGSGIYTDGSNVEYFSGDTPDNGAYEYFWENVPSSYKKSYRRANQTLATPWLGLQSVDEEGGENAAAYYIDGRPFLFLPRPKEYQATLKAVTYPDAFAEIMGVHEVADGMYLDSQQGDSFDLSYRTLVGNVTQGTDHGYKIHLVYNCTVAPQAMTYESMSNSINPTSFSWTIQAVPVPVEGFRPTAHIIIDTRHMDQHKIDAVEEMIYGSDTEVAKMPSPQAIFDLLSFGDTIIVTDNGDGSFDVTGSYENVYMVQDGVFRVDNVDGQDNGDGTFTISTTYE